MVDTSDDRFGAYASRLSDLSKYKRDEPKRAWENLESLHNQAVSGALDNTSEFKQARRDWNRQYKNTPVGIMASGVDLDANPFGAQDLYHDMSSQLSYDAPAAYDEMYPIQPGKIFSAIAENIGPMSWLKNILPKREKITPQNVLEMRKRFPGIDKLVPGGGLSELVPEHLRQKAIFDINETVEEGEGIFSGTGQSALEEIDVEKYTPTVSDRVLAEWFITVKPEMNLTVERTEELIRDLEPTTKQVLIEQYKESQ